MICKEKTNWCLGKCRHAENHEWRLDCKGGCLKETMEFVENTTCETCQDTECHYNPKREGFSEENGDHTIDLHGFFQDRCPVILRKKFGKPAECLA